MPFDCPFICPSCGGVECSIARLYTGQLNHSAGSSEFHKNPWQRSSVPCRSHTRTKSGTRNSRTSSWLSERWSSEDWGPLDSSRGWTWHRSKYSRFPPLIACAPARGMTSESTGYPCWPVFGGAVLPRPSLYTRSHRRIRVAKFCCRERQWRTYGCEPVKRLTEHDSWVARGAWSP